MGFVWVSWVPQAAELSVVWVCDAVHGNTFTSGNGYKTRPFDAVIAEIKLCFEVPVVAARLPRLIYSCVANPTQSGKTDLFLELH